MKWFEAHPYATGLLAAVALVAFGAFVVNQRASVTPSASGTNAWGGGLPVNPATGATGSVPPATEPPQNQETIMQQVQSGPPFTYLPPQTASSTTVVNSAQANSFDFNAFMAQLEQESAPATDTSASVSGNGSMQNAYAYVPSGLVATTTSEQTQTPAQKALYDYGNEVGSYIESFETENPNEAATLTNQITDRGNADKAAAVEQLGQNLSQVGKSLLNIQDVPTSAVSDNTALAESYEEIGANLALVPQAQRDSDVVTAIETYDTSADTFTRNYVALANLFASYGVVFAASDPGSVFTFTPTNL